MQFERFGAHADGVPVDRLYAVADPAAQPAKRRIAEALFEMTTKMFLRDNFIHGDLHAGNLLWDARRGKLTVLDAPDEEEEEEEDAQGDEYESSNGEIEEDVDFAIDSD